MPFAIKYRIYTGNRNQDTLRGPTTSFPYFCSIKRAFGAVCVISSSFKPPRNPVTEMKKILLPAIALLTMFCNVLSQNTINVFDKILFYDGYAATVTLPVPAGVIRHRNDLYAVKLSDQQLKSIGSTLDLKVTIKAACDNYDRIGSVNLAFVPKGSATYTPANVKRLEIARFITPFMNKNVKPDTVPYNYSVNNVAKILKESTLNALFDFWLELEVFGVPYAANTEVPGCSGRTDVFYGSLDLVTNASIQPQATTRVLPLFFKADFNNYQVGASDVAGKTVKSATFTIDTALTNTALFLITSNHGSNSGGEEYLRRNHFVYLDGKQVLTYKPGRTSCEPFRKFNTQANGIYGSTVKTDAQWQSFSNWCPGDVISIRRIDLGTLAAGSHTFKIEVPDAVFTGKQGNFPLSLYLQGTAPGSTVSIGEDRETAVWLYPNPITSDRVTIEAEKVIRQIIVYNAFGQQVMTETNNPMNTSSLPPGVYTVHILFEDRAHSIQRMIKN